jgi:hypothetical protein
LIGVMVFTPSTSGRISEMEAGALAPMVGGPA